MIKQQLLSLVEHYDTIHYRNTITNYKLVLNMPNVTYYDEIAENQDFKIKGKLKIWPWYYC